MQQRCRCVPELSVGPMGVWHQAVHSRIEMLPLSARDLLQRSIGATDQP